MWYYLYKEDEHADIGNDCNSDIQLYGSQLGLGKKPWGSWNLATVDCSKYGEHKKRSNDIDADLNCKLSFRQHLTDICIIRDDDQKDNYHQDWTNDSHHHSKNTAAWSDNYFGDSGRDKPKNKVIKNKRSLVEQSKLCEGPPKYWVVLRKLEIESMYKVLSD